jgi:hypothetical protein
MNAVNHLGDHDWYRVELVAGLRYQFRLNSTVNGPGLPALPDPFLTLRNSGGYIRATDDDSGGNRNSLITWTPATPGLWFLDAGAYRNESTGGYTLSVTQVTPTPTDDFAANDSTWGQLQVNSSTNARLERIGDRDWFRVALRAGRTYRITVDTLGAWPRADQMTNPNVHLRNSGGRSLAYNDNFTYSHQFSQITYRALNSTVFYIDVGGSLSTTSPDGISPPRGLGRYRVTLREV